MEYGRSPPRIDGMVSLKVDNLAYRTTIDDLRRVFSRFGEVGDIYIPRDPYTFESRGFAFVRYCTDREADCAIRGMDGHKVDGREVRVQRAKYGRPTPNRRRVTKTANSQSANRINMLFAFGHLVLTAEVVYDEGCLSVFVFSMRYFACCDCCLEYSLYVLTLKRLQSFFYMAHVDYYFLDFVGFSDFAYCSTVIIYLILTSTLYLHQNKTAYMTCLFTVYQSLETALNVVTVDNKHVKKINQHHVNLNQLLNVYMFLNLSQCYNYHHYCYCYLLFVFHSFVVDNIGDYLNYIHLALIIDLNMMMSMKLSYYNYDKFYYQLIQITSSLLLNHVNNKHEMFEKYNEDCILLQFDSYSVKCCCLLVDLLVNIFLLVYVIKSYQFDIIGTDE
ncbi:putative splicing factor, arginine/serine-rich 4 [Schistosoma japonicum]|nr:putative splicing factor, arginine/serine-rich 4 [Schistosoma japonicum]